MSSPSIQGASVENAATADANDASGVNGPPSVAVMVIIQNRYTFDPPLVTGRQIREKAGVPPGFALYRRVRGGNEPIADDAQLELHRGDHFFARPAQSAP